MINKLQQAADLLAKRDSCPDIVSIKYQLLKTIIEDKLQLAGISIGKEQITLEIIDTFYDADFLTVECKAYLHYNHFHEDVYLGRGCDHE